MRKMKTLNEYEEGYFREHPEEIDEYIKVIFEEYAKDEDIGALLSSLRILSRVKGISSMAETVGMTRKGLQKSLSEQGNPKFSNVNSILHAMGYSLMPQKLDVHTV
ncbi:hypothetical protein MNBD_NITROSPIRAE01-1323 [hydrothermal vent metagenome]|uniref:Addiction module antidote protein n=1 Tax=hydrothermal vent metagenome TaxID=652676 RepID=A0A3B1CJ20_9ZZZZ